MENGLSMKTHFWLYLIGHIKMILKLTNLKINS